MMWALGLLVVVQLASVAYQYTAKRTTKQAQRLCVTLKDSQGVFVALCVEKTAKRWTFEKGQTVPQKTGVESQPIAGRIHVPYENILYYQELPNVVE